ncbi:DHS-like NAD/FAD-binding domain-containing protein [Hypoxylon sp. FL1150]|nr:DHS-like NAD/FAD-binding domain-containing protein [Hypoxylon sp. FL1150]
MANTAPKVAAEERREAPAAVDKKAEALAKLIRKSKHLVVFTGAGVSTSAGIPDFRGPEGSWTLRAQGRERTKPVNTLQAIPTATHMTLVELQSRGILKYLISQNCDGLHRKSGILPDRISELHGNSNREYCKDCNKEYIRDFRAVASYEKTAHDHRTGRKCALCGGVLLDTIINFGESLFTEPLQRARDHAEKADVFLVLGSSLTVSPANELPEPSGRKKTTTTTASLAICNLQDTALDGLADLARCRASTSTATPITFLRSVKLEYNRRVARSEPFVIAFRGDLDPGTELKLELEFMGNYGEPNLDIIFRYSGDEEEEKAAYLLEYNPQNGEWKVTEQADCAADHGASGNLRRDGNANIVPAEASVFPSEAMPASTANSVPEIIEID